MFLIVFIGNIRTSYGQEKKTSNVQDEIVKIIESTLWGQTTSRAVPLLIMNGNLKYHRYPFFFYHLTNPILSFKYKAGGDSIIALEKYNNPSQVLMGNISVNASISGAGYGTAFLGESWEFGGYVGIVLFSFLLSFILVFFDSSSLSFRPICTPIIFYFLLSIPCLPRDSLLAFLGNSNYIFFSYTLLFIIDLLIGYINLKGRKKCL